jgi:hypothetical protein
LIADVDGVGYALRYGIIEPKNTALDGVADTGAYRALAAKGYHDGHADSDRRREELQAERSRTKKKKTER